MAAPILKGTDISKKYRLGTLGSGSFRQDMLRWWKSDILKKESRFFNEAEGRPADFWALRNISFEIGQGEVWGVIGQNGAGKSTLLKLISRITKPTSGKLQGRGKISSLLEVGTGFHQELTGRENIYLSGYMLGMRTTDIRRNFDAIVDFSGIEQFIDTPVKRYSSGMYVRLAFSVAAHLEPDILLVDEVLAVGDSGFQKKCLGKMREVASDKGRTIIYVSHNLQSVLSLCTRCMWLHEGQLRGSGEARTIVREYTAGVHGSHLQQRWDDAETRPGNGRIRMSEVYIRPVGNSKVLDTATALDIGFEAQVEDRQEKIGASLQVFSSGGECVSDVHSAYRQFADGRLRAGCRIPAGFLNNGSYFLSILFTNEDNESLYYHHDSLVFEIEDPGNNKEWFARHVGFVRPPFELVFSPSNNPI